MLHQAIRQEYGKRERKEFTCYRGANLKEYEIEELRENVGNHISTLGFLSTSLNQYISLSFMTNTIIEIEVDENDRSINTNFNYFFIDQGLQI